MKTRRTTEKTQKDRVKLDDQIHDTLIEMGLIIPQTEEDVRLARTALARTACPPLPTGLADPWCIIDRLGEGDPKPQRKVSALADPPRLSIPALLKRLKKAGLDSRLLRRLFPRNLRDHVNSFVESGAGNEQVLAMDVAKIVSRVFGWSLDVTLDPATPLELCADAIDTARFKLPARASGQWLLAYTAYAHTLVIILLDATKNLPRRPLPTSAADIRDALKAQYGSVTFEHALHYTWSLGIPVLPLRDSGAFHGACWRIDGRNVIVLKQRVRSLARWLFDLIHELVHLGTKPEQTNLSIIEYESPDAKRLSIEEGEANRIAGDVILDGRAEELAQMCIAVAQGKIPWLKRAVTTVATSQHVAVDALANYMAFRLSLQGEKWWPTAIGLQNTDVDPWQVARRVLQEQVDFSSLGHLDRALLEQALLDEGELEV